MSEAQLLAHIERLEKRLAALESKPAMVGAFSSQSATTNTVLDAVRVERLSTGTAADGIGAGIGIFVQDASGNVDEVGRIDAVLTTAAHATEAGALYLKVLGVTRLTVNSAGDLIQTNDARIGGGLYVGSTATDPAADTITSDGIMLTANDKGYWSKNAAAAQSAGWKQYSDDNVYFDNPAASGQFIIRLGASYTQVLSITTAGVVTIPGSLTVTGNSRTSGVFMVDGLQVVSNRVVDARCDDAINSGDATTDGVIDSLRDAMIAHGLIAAA